MVAALSLVLVLSAAPSECKRELFRIERSKNANVVLYEARPGATTALDRREPVIASWLLLAKNGEREPLSFFEQLIAYGFEAHANKAGDEAVLKLKALKQRGLKVVKQGACLVAVGLIDGAEAVLQRVYVTTDERGAMPEVKSVELFGVDVATGQARVEKLTK